MARVPASGSETPASAPALAALADEIDRFPNASRTRGARYVREERVGPINREGNRVAAIVRGTRAYATAWTWRAATSHWAPGCSCPVAPRCKHAYALARRVLDDAAGLAPPERAEARSHRPLDRLRTRDLWERHLALDLLLADAPVSVSSHEPPLEEALREPDPDLRCWQLARELARRTGGWVPRALAPFRERADLAARHLARVRRGLADDLTAWAARREPAPVRSVRLVFGLMAGPDGAARVTVEARVATPRAGETPRSAAQLRQLRSDLVHAPETFTAEQADLLEWLVAHDVGGREAFRQSAPWLVTHVLRGLLERLGPTIVATWATDLPPALATRGSVVPGTLIVMHPEPLRLLPACVERGGELWLELRFQGEGDRQHGLDDVIYLRGTDPFDRPSPGLAIVAGAFARVVEEPPATIVDRFMEAGGIPVAADQRVATVGRLAARFPHLRDALATHTRVHAVTPAVALDLRDDDWLQVRVFAHGGGADWQPGQMLQDGTPTFEYGPDLAWERRSAPPGEAWAPIVAALPDDGAATPADTASIPDGASPSASATPVAPPPAPEPASAWLEVPDPRLVEPVVAWLRGVPVHAGARRGPGGHGVRWPDREIGWWMRATRRSMEALGAAWEERPPGVTWFGTAAVRRLLGGARVAARLRVTPSGMDWFAVEAEWRAEGLALTEADVAALRAATTRFVKLPSGWAAREAVAAHDEVAELLAELGLDPAEAREQRVSLWQLAGARAASLDALERLGADADTRGAVDTLRARIRGFAGVPPIPSPPGLTAGLRPYQEQGLAFLAHASSLGIGAVLADDMGLGKTVQALAWLAHLKAHDPDGGPCLVVCPASVVHNWEREAARFTPHFRVLLLTSGGDRHDHWRALARHDLVVTTYALLRRDATRWREVRLRAVILDEAQNVKNPDAAVTRAAHALDAQHRLALTGTPLENRALDLWSIVSAVEPAYLGGRAAFSRRFDRPDAPAASRTLLAAKLRPILLRRTKAQVAPELPPRIEERRDCALTSGQRRLYVAELARSRQLVRDLETAPGGVGRNKIAVLAALTRLRQICCHPALVGGRSELGSGKFAALFELLEPLLAEGHKVLLFSQFVQCLKLLRAEIQARGIAHHVLTGQTTRRAQVVGAFQEDPRPAVFLVSLKAGGTGLNLTAASYVVLFDPWWNPAVEAQAIDRAHRIGQDRTVIAYRMLARGTVEERIWELQRRKAALTRDVLGEDGFARALDRSDLEYLLTDVAGDDVDDDEPAAHARQP